MAQAHMLGAPGPYTAKYCEWVRKQFKDNTSKDTNTGQEDGFISVSELKAYLKHELPHLLGEAIGNRDRSVSIDEIDAHYLRGFAILLVIGRGSFISHFVRKLRFQDHHLPLVSKPDDWPGHDKDSSWEHFDEYQWKFFPAEMHFGKKDHDPKSIMPFLEKYHLGDGASSTLYLVRIHRDFDFLSKKPEGSEGHELYVLKSYMGPSAADYYTIETRNYSSIQKKGKGHDGLIKYYGGYTLNGTYNIILENAEGGSLEHYMEKSNEPKTAKGIAAHWTGFVECVRGLQNIHNRTDFKGVNDPMKASQGLHQDICPGNILLIHNPAPLDPAFTFLMVLADLGISHFNNTSEQREIFSTFAGERYSAPECFPRSAFDEKSEHVVTPKIDIWALGCVILELATWLVLGLEEVKKFESKRVQETGQGETENVGDRFHNGRPSHPARLKCVSKQFDYIREELRKHDYITGKMLNLADRMLQPDPKNRPEIKQVRQEAEDMLWNAGRNSVIEPIEESQEPTAPNIIASGRQSKKTHVDTSPGLVSDVVNHTETTAVNFNYPLGKAFESGSIAMDDAEYSVIVASSSSKRTKPYPESDTTFVGHASSKTPPTTTRLPVVSTITHQDSLVQSPEQLSPSNEVPPASRDQIAKVRAQPRLSTTLNFDGTPLTNNISQRSHLSIPTAQDWMRQIKRWENTPQWKKDTDRPQKLDDRLINLRKRHHIFLIDDGETMGQHHLDMVEIFEILVHVIAHYDKRSKIEMYMTNSEKHFKEKNADRLVQHMNKLDFNGQTNIDRGLDKIAKVCGASATSWTLNNIRKKLATCDNKSVYILTDAAWEGGGNGKTFVEDMRYKLRMANKTPEQFGVQFIQFGDDEERRERLVRLDDMADQDGKDRRMDIVDTVYWRDDILKILLGSFMKVFDRKPGRYNVSRGVSKDGE